MPFGKNMTVFSWSSISLKRSVPKCLYDMFVLSARPVRYGCCNALFIWSPCNVGSVKRPSKFGFGVGAATNRTFKATTPFGGDKKAKRDALAKRQGEQRASVVDKMRGEKAAACAAAKANEKENVPQAARAQ